jgi:hypothetical protein
MPLPPKGTAQNHQKMCYKLLAHAFWERNSLFITEQAYNQLR